MPTFVENSVADDIITTFRSSTGATKYAALRTLMDLVSGVKAYDIRLLKRQGVISKVFTREHARAHGSYGINVSVSIDDAISEFWTAVFANVSKVAMTGDEVSVRVVGGTGQMATVGGKRPTRCNGVNYLRLCGATAIRNLLNTSYRKNLIQSCDDCLHVSSINSIEAAISCPRCQSTDTARHWPSGNAAFRAKKTRVCDACKCEWPRTFKYTCRACSSTNVSLSMRDEPLYVETHLTEEAAPTGDIDASTLSQYGTFLERVRGGLSGSAKTPVTRTTEIFDLLYPQNGVSAICVQCVAKAPLVCELDCGDTGCSHPKIKDPAKTCGATTFNVVDCVSYAKKISEYHGCSVALASRRVNKIRTHLVDFIMRHKAGAPELYLELENMGLVKVKPT